MFSYFISVFLLITAYFTYSKYLEKNFGVDERNTPATTLSDGVDFVEMDWKKALLIQFLNIAGLGPVTGAIAGAMWGTVSFVWIVFGCIFIGAVHDYYSGMISMRHEGKNIPDLIGLYLGDFAKSVSKYVIIFLLIIVGIAFVTGPAEILRSFTGISFNIWLVIIAIYYLLATILPIDKIIGKIYPFFGAALIIMVILLMGSLIIKGYQLPEITLKNLHPKQLSIFPFLFVVISCGAVSGFHSTQSILMGRCVKTEYCGRKTFYGAMIIEGIVALTWASLAIAFFGSPEGLGASGGGMVAIGKISTSLLGPLGAAFSIVGVVALPISTGDTAFRSARLTIADALNIEQKSLKNRFLIAIPLFIIAGFMSQLGFNTLWRYVAVTNQLLATITLWMITFYLKYHNKNYIVTALPTAFMTGIMGIYVLVAPEGFAIKGNIPYFIGTILGILTIIYFVLTKEKTITKEKGVAYYENTNN